MTVPSTLMSISGPGFEVFNNYSTRALSMSMEPIPEAMQFFRTVNGALEDVSLNQFHNKYNVSIQCTDFESPIFVGLRPGLAVTLTCVPHLGVRQDDDSAGLLTLSMFVANWSVQRDEWGARTQWTLNLVM